MIRESTKTTYAQADVTTQIYINKILYNFGKTHQVAGKWLNAQRLVNVDKRGQPY